MHIALNGSTLGPCSLDEELDAAAAAGFRLVELWAPKLEGVTDLGRRLTSRGLRALSVNSLEGAGERDLREPARRQAAWAAAGGAPYVVCVPGRRRDGLEEAMASLAEICRQESAELRQGGPPAPAVYRADPSEHAGGSLHDWFGRAFGRPRRKRDD